MPFDDQKRSVLSREDASHKGAWDAPIKQLLDRINGLNDYFTTSSCSGRITLIARNVSSKKDAIRLLNAHQKIASSEVASIIHSYNDDLDIWFMFEPLILHITCRDQQSAVDLLAKVQPICKHSGIVFTHPWRIEVRASERIEAPITKGNNILVSNEYLWELIDRANEAMDRNDAIIKRVMELFEGL